jgi:hypothetical protein
LTGSPPTPVGAALFTASPARRIIQSRLNGTRVGEMAWRIACQPRVSHSEASV